MGKICQFYLKGMCKFGDRCFNEHRDPNQKGLQNDRGSNDQRGYQGNRGGGGGRNNYDDGGGRQNYDSGGHRNYGGGGRNNYDGGGGGHQNYYGGGRNNYDGGGHRNYGGGGRNNYDGGGGGRNNYDGGGGGHQNYYGGGHQNYAGGGRQNYAGGRNEGNRSSGRNDRNKSHNQFSALSHQPDPEMSHFSQKSQPRSRTASSSSSLHNTDHTLLDHIKKDMKEWHESSQWPLSCYAISANEPCFGDFEDFSPEEIRHEDYKAKTTGNHQHYLESLQQVLQTYVRKREEMAVMSVTTLQQELSRSAHQPTTSSGLFGKAASTSIFGVTTSLVTSPSQNLFGSNVQSMSITDSSSGSTLPASSGTPGPFSSQRGPFSSQPGPFSSQPGPFSSQPGPFSSQPGPFSTSSGSTIKDSGSSLFRPSQETSSNISPPTTVRTSEVKTVLVPALKCREQDLKAFKQDHFVLGAIPECPPPPELC